jgi:pyruvate,water dikinase
VDHGANLRRTESQGSTTAGLLTGIGASRGTYTGRVRVVLTEREFDRIEPGDLLVCPVTSPVWSVVFPRIGGLVTDAGGTLSHPAIIAREYGIPAVVDTRNGTTALQDGQLVTVNGDAGIVTVVS